MPVKNKRPRRGRRMVWLLVLLIGTVLAAAVIFDLFIRRPPQVAGGIVVPDKVLHGHRHDLWAVRFSPDGALVATGGVDSTLRLWNRNTGAPVAVLHQPLGITSLEFSPDGYFIVTGSYDGIVRLWDVQARRVVRQFRGHSGTVWSVAVSADGRTLASGGEDHTVRLWDVATGAPLRSLRGHTMNIWKVRFAPDDRRVVSSSFDRTVRIWDWRSGTLLQTLQGHTQAVVGLAISADGTMIASSSDDKTIRLWDGQSGRLLRTLPGWKEHVYAVTFSPDGRRLVSGSRDNGTVGEVLQNFLGANATPRGITVRIWDTGTGRLLQTLTAHQNDVMDVAWSADGTSMASASDDGTVRLWRCTKRR